MAVFLDNKFLIDFLLDRDNCNVNTLGTYKGFYSATPLYVACSFDRRETIKRLLRLGANVNIPDIHERSPLMTLDFDFYDNIDIANQLIHHGANINLRDDNGNTALHHAIARGMYEYVGYLMSRGADPFIKNKYEENALICFALKVASSVDVDDDDDNSIIMRDSENDSEDDYEKNDCDIITYDSEDDSENEYEKNLYEKKSRILDLFISKLEKEDVNSYSIVYDLFGAAYSPCRAKYQKKIWGSSLKLNGQKITFENRKLLDVIGDRTCEFEDVKEIHGDFNCLIQSVLICQRILTPKHRFTVMKLKQLLENYIFVHDTYISIRLLRYILEYVYTDDDDDVYIFKAMTILCEFVKKFEFTEVYNVFIIYFNKFMNRKKEITEIITKGGNVRNIDVDSYNNTIFLLYLILCGLYEKCQNNKDDLKVLTDFVKSQFKPANFKKLKISTVNKDETSIFKNCNLNFDKFYSSL